MELLLLVPHYPLQPHTANTETMESTMPATATTETEQFAPSQDQASKLQDVRNLLDTLEGRGATAQRAPTDDRAAAVTAPVTASEPRRNRRRKEPDMNPAPTTTTAQANLPTLDDYLAKADELGQKAGEGRNVGQAMLIELLTGGYLGALTFEPRQGKEDGDHAAIAQRYATKQALVNRNDAKAGNMKKLKSDFGLAIKTGQNPKFGTGQPLEVTNEYVTLLDKLRKKQMKGLRDTYNGLLNLWRTLNKTGVVPANEKALEAFCFQPGARPVTVDRALEAARKLLMKASQGKLPNCDDMDDSKEIKDAVASITKRLAARAKMRGQAAQPASQPAQQAAAA
jgi:hypothetical protein